MKFFSFLIYGCVVFGFFTIAKGIYKIIHFKNNINKSAGQLFENSVESCKVCGGKVILRSLFYTRAAGYYRNEDIIKNMIACLQCENIVYEHEKLIKTSKPALEDQFQVNRELKPPTHKKMISIIKKDLADKDENSLTVRRHFQLIFLGFVLILWSIFILNILN